MEQADDALGKLREEIDVIDAELHGLIMRRAAMVDRIRALKPSDGAKIRPGREAQILRSLAARHSGPFPIPALVRIWREIFAAVTRLQGPFSVAVYLPDGRDGLWDLARDHFGASTPITTHGRTGDVVEAITKGAATVGVLPYPARDDMDPWWPSLASAAPDTPKISAKLPFAGAGNARDAGDALVIAQLDQEPTGGDTTFLIVEPPEDVADRGILGAFKDAEISASVTTKTPDTQGSGVRLFLIETGDFVAPDDARLATVNGLLGTGAARVVGGYARPLSVDNAKPAAAGAVA